MDYFKAVKGGAKVPKKEFLGIVKDSYKYLDSNQIASIIMLIEKMLKAKQSGESLTVGFRDWNQDGTRR
tara:strand:- start:363 stop:569 length:207 start_codon:yes stop_codon:yes gene_type:complete